MNEFVNYSNRSAALPEGCKDLIDVLKPKRKRKRGWQTIINGPPMIQTFDGGLKDVESLLRRFLQSDAHPIVSIHTESDQISCALAYEPGETKAIVCIDSKGTASKATICLCCADAELEESLRKVFQEAEILPMYDAVGSIAGVEKRLLNYPLPVFVRDATNLITKVLRQCCRISEESKLSFLWVE